MCFEEAYAEDSKDSSIASDNENTDFVDSPLVTRISQKRKDTTTTLDTGITKLDVRHLKKIPLPNDIACNSASHLADCVTTPTGLWQSRVHFQNTVVDFIWRNTASIDILPSMASNPTLMASLLGQEPCQTSTVHTMEQNTDADAGSKKRRRSKFNINAPPGGSTYPSGSLLAFPVQCYGENSKKHKIERALPLARQVPNNMYTTSETPLSAELRTA